LATHSRNGILYVLSRSYNTYYGDDYHLRRIIDGRSIIYIICIRDTVVAVSYVKRNLRRGGTAVYPEKYRRRGLAEALVRASLIDFPEQYSILSISDRQMIALLLKVGLNRAATMDAVRVITNTEFERLSNFRLLDGCLVFERRSPKRGLYRETLTMLFRSSDATTR
jgi:hypothetical protein